MKVIGPIVPNNVIFENDRGEPLNVEVIDYEIIGSVHDVIKVNLTMFVRNVIIDENKHKIVILGNDSSKYTKELK